MNAIPEIKAMMKKVNDYWLCETPIPGNCSWERAAYYLGNMAAYEVLQDPSYLQCAVDWANENHWISTTMLDVTLPTPTISAAARPIWICWLSTMCPVIGPR